MYKHLPWSPGTDTHNDNSERAPEGYTHLGEVYASVGVVVEGLEEVSCFVFTQHEPRGRCVVHPIPPGAAGVCTTLKPQLIIVDQSKELLERELRFALEVAMEQVVHCASQGLGKGPVTPREGLPQGDLLWGETWAWFQWRGGGHEHTTITRELPSHERLGRVAKEQTRTQAHAHFQNANFRHPCTVATHARQPTIKSLPLEMRDRSLWLSARTLCSTILLLSLMLREGTSCAQRVFGVMERAKETSVDCVASHVGSSVTVRLPVVRAAAGDEPLPRWCQCLCFASFQRAFQVLNSSIRGCVRPLCSQERICTCITRVRSS